MCEQSDMHTKQMYNVALALTENIDSCGNFWWNSLTMYIFIIDFITLKYADLHFCTDSFINYVSTYEPLV